MSYRVPPVKPFNEFIIDENFITSKSKSSPFIGMKVNGLVKYTILNGGIVYEA